MHPAVASVDPTPRFQRIQMSLGATLDGYCLLGYGTWQRIKERKANTPPSSRSFHNFPLLLLCASSFCTASFFYSPNGSSLCLSLYKQSPAAAAAAGSMAAEESTADDVSFLERLSDRPRNRDTFLFFPIILGVMGPPRREDAQAQQSSYSDSERIVLVNPFTQGMIVIDGDGADLEAFLRGLSEMEPGKSGPPPASKSSIEAMPAVQVSEEGAECAICLEEMEVGGEAKEMPCRHRYHGECIGKWLGLHGSCPVCRYKMPLEEEEVKKGEGGGVGTTDGEIWVSFSEGTMDSTTTSTPQPQQSTTTDTHPVPNPNQEE